jgi:hypothetical protein
MRARFLLIGHIDMSDSGSDTRPAAVRDGTIEVFAPALLRCAPNRRQNAGPVAP